MKHLTTLWIGALLFFASSSLFAQHYVAYRNYTIGVGTIYFSGDIRQTLGELRPAGMIGIGFPITEQVSTRFNFLYGNYRGADSLSGDNKARNLSFKSMLAEGSAQMIWEPFKKRNGAFYSKAHLSPYFVYGLSLFYMSPKAKYNGEWVDLQQIGTEGQYIPERFGKYPKPYKKFQFGLPLGGGLSYYLKNNISLNAEFMLHFTFTDYMDDISSSQYVNPELLKGYSEVAAALSYRGDGILTETNTRGNPKSRDFYLIPSLSLTYHLGQRKTFKG